MEAAQQRVRCMFCCCDASHLFNSGMGMEGESGGHLHILEKVLLVSNGVL